MVTSSCFADVNKDGWQDLIVTGEWMPLKIFINNKGVFKEHDVPQSTGFGNRYTQLILMVMDIQIFLQVIGGIIQNYIMEKRPALKLYVKDFDGNG